MRQLLNATPTWCRTLQRLFLFMALIVATQLATLPASATGVYEIPNLTAQQSNWIFDKADVLSRLNTSKLSRKLEDLAHQTGNEVRFVTIHRLDYGETPASFASQLFNKWFPTPEGQANQVLLVLDNVTNGTAIRTGDKIKSILPDAIADSIAAETVQVPIRQGNNYNQALLDASDRLAAVLSGLPDPGPPKVAAVAAAESNYKTAEETNSTSATYIVIGLLVAATVIPMVTYFLYQGQ
ncbi:MAG TPA: TPM domain-containing protein [Candidatus Caenarcaniphilales bacterium]